jgi:hypothetical protein
MGMDVATARSAPEANCQQLHGRANVVAIGAGYKMTKGKITTDLSIVCSVVKKLPPFWD